MQNGWQPMDTAPKGGELTDLWSKSGYRLSDCIWFVFKENSRLEGGVYLHDDVPGWMDADGNRRDPAEVIAWRPAPGGPNGEPPR